MSLPRKIINKGDEYYYWMVSETRHKKPLEMLKARRAARLEALKTLRETRLEAIKTYRSKCIARKMLCKSPPCVRITIPGKRSFCFSDVSETETIGTLTEKIAESLGVDKQNWGFYVVGPKREFLPDSAKVREINQSKNLHFLPRTVI
jgi:hypothetical protein